MMDSGNVYGPFLLEIANSESRIKAVLLTDLSGVLKSVVERTTATASLQSADRLHAFLGSAIAQSFMEMGSQHALNQLNTVIVEYQEGSLLLAPTSHGVLMVLADPGANLGLIRYKITLVAKKMHQLEPQLELSQVPPITGIPRKHPTKISTNLEPSTSTEEKGRTDEKQLLKQALSALDDI